MKQKFETNRKNSTEKYCSPNAEVISVNSQNVLCQSGGTEQYGNTNDPDWGFKSGRNKQ